MAAKSKKVTFNMINATLPKTETHEVVFGDFVLEVKEYLTFAEATQFVTDAYSFCFDADTNEYVPEARDMAIRFATLFYYANIEMPKDLSKAYNVAYGTTLYQDVCFHINDEQYTTLIAAFDERVEYSKAMNISAAVTHVNELLKAMDDMMSGSAKVLDAYNSPEFAEAITSISNISTPVEVDKKERTVIMEGAVDHTDTEE